MGTPIVSMKEMMDTKARGKELGGAVRKSYTLEEKLRILAETQELGASVSKVARAHDINTNLVFTWRRQHARGELAGRNEQSIALLPVEVEAVSKKRVRASTRDAAKKPRRRERPGFIEIDLPRASVRIHGHVDGEVLRHVIAALRIR